MTLPRSFGAGAIALALCAASASAELRRAPRIVPRTDTPHVRAALEILDPPRLRGRTVEEVAIELGQLGNGAVQGLFALLAGTLEGPVFTSALEDDPARGDVPSEDAIVVRALKRLSPDAVAAGVAVQATKEASIDVRRVALRVLGEVCGADGVDVWVDILTEVEPIHLRRAYLQGPCEEALGRMLARDEHGFARLRERGKELTNELFALAVSGVAASGRARGVDTLLAWLGRDRERDLELLRQIGRLGEEALGTIAEDRLSWVRPYIEDDDPRVRREACMALARLGDFRAYRALVEKLDDEDRLTAAAAEWALRRLSGRSLDGVRAWIEHIDAEMEWYERDGARHVAALAADDAHTAIAAARELVQHPLFKHEVAPEIGALVDREDTGLAASACAALGALGSRTAVDSLLRALGRPDDDVQDAAWAALRALTGLRLPRDAGEWRAVLLGD